MKRAITLSRKQLRKIINEAISIKPAGEPEPFQINDETLDTTSQKFESARHKAFHEALQPVVDETIRSLVEISDNLSISDREETEEQIKYVAEQMREELLGVISERSEEIVSRIFK